MNILVGVALFVILRHEKERSKMKNYTTSDLALAAFLKLHGRKLVAASKFPNGRFLFEFDDDGSCASLALEFVNGEFSAYDAQVRAIKKALYGS